MTQTHEESVQKLAELIKDVKVAMMTTAEADGGLHSRPMHTQDTGFDGILWFFTDVDSTKVHELDRDHHVNLSYADPGENKYVSVSGVARKLRDPEKAKQMWSVFHKAWFDGPDDPKLALLRVEVQKAEYWDSPSSKVIQTIGFAKAILTGKRYADEATEHQKVNLSPE
ncbi:MAG: pyridoxamine 5'-phosphate oxidase family protein [Bryobacteraceae bacterium]